MCVGMPQSMRDEIVAKLLKEEKELKIIPVPQVYVDMMKLITEKELVTA